MLLMIAASPREFGGLRQVTKLASTDVRWLARAMLPTGEAMLVANGMGRVAAEAAVRKMLATCQVDAVISTGFAGALDPSLAVGDVFFAEAVRYDGLEYQACLPRTNLAGIRRGFLLTVDHVVQSARAKQELWRRGSDAVDMEALAVAAVAAEHGLPFYCVRSISDSAMDDLPVDFNQALRPNGTISAWSVVGQALRGRGRWSGLLGLRRDARMAARSLAGCLTRCEFRA